MKKVMALGLIAGLILTLCACGKADDKTVATTTAAKEAKKTVDVFGIVKAKEVKDIILDFPAVIEKVPVKEGQKVKNGDVLITLNKSEYELQIKTKELALETAKKELSAKQGYQANNSDPEVRKLYSDLKNAQDLFNQAVQELANKEQLLKSGSLSQFDYDEFKKTYDAKKKAVNDIKLSIDNSNFNKNTEVDQKSTSAGTIEAELNIMKNKLSKSYLKGNDIVSDVKNGVVYEIGYVQGDLAANDRKVLSILDLDSIIVEANVDEEFIKDVKLGAEVTINPVADKTKDYKGKVTRISEKAIQKNGETYIPVEITFDSIDSFILPDYNVDVKIKI